MTAPAAAATREAPPDLQRRPEARRDAGTLFFGLSIFVAAVVGLWGLDRFPIFFLGDEAVESVRAESTIRDGFRDEFEDFLPILFKNGQTFNLGITTYVHMLPTSIFGHSIEATRGIELLFAVSALAAVALALRDSLGLSFWWIAVLVITTIPGWFLHVRMAFGIPIAIGFFGWFLYFYLRYRGGRPRALFPALLFAALAFYSYMGMQPVLGALAVLLAIIDAPWHWKQRRLLLPAAALLLILAYPMVRFIRTHPEDVSQRLENYDSYWMKPWPLSRKLATFAAAYADAVSPSYWLDPQSRRDLERHRMKGYGHILLASVPFALGGLALCLAKLSDPARRILLAVLVASPVGAALVGPGITREFSFVLAYGILLVLAIDALLTAAVRRLRPLAVSAAAFGLFAAGSVAMLADGLRHGPTWYSDYSLYGMQWGAKEVFGTIRRDLAANPRNQYWVSHDWANGAEQIVIFFFGADRRVAVRHLDHYQERWAELDPRDIHVLTAEEYDHVRATPRFVIASVDKVIPYPDGRPGFYFVHLENPPDLPTTPGKYGLPAESAR